MYVRLRVMVVLQLVDLATFMNIMIFAMIYVVFNYKPSLVVQSLINNMLVIHLI